MDVSVETLGPITRRMTVKIPAERVGTAYQDRLKKTAAKARVPGFRPGKAPLRMIEAQYGLGIRQDISTDIVRQTYGEALDQGGVRPAGSPELSITEDGDDGITYTAEVEVFPEITLAGLDGLKIERPEVEIADADIDRLIETLRSARRAGADVERAAENGDRVKVDIVGRVGDEAFEGGTHQNLDIELGAGRFLPDLEKGIVGHAPGETFTVPVRFPDDYPADALKGKDATFEVTLNGVHGFSLPEATDPEFLKAHGVEEGAGVEGLREKGRTALAKERDKALRNRLKTQVFDQLLAANPIEVPKALVADEVTALRTEAANRYNLGKVAPERQKELLPDAMFEEAARRRSRLGLLVSELVRARGIQVDAARVTKALDDIAADFEQPDDVRQYYAERPELMQGLTSMVMEDMVVENLAGSAETTTPSMGLQELLNPPAAVQS